MRDLLRPNSILIHRVIRARQMGKGPTVMNRRRQSACVDLKDLFRREPFREPRTEVTTGFHDDRPGSSDIQPEHVEENWVGRLRAIGYYDHRYAADP